ncbi:MAG: NnrS family protein [Pirellulales bacterium]|nr:NnrS family protein [Pirellulales bacterium]
MALPLPLAEETVAACGEPRLYRPFFRAGIAVVLTLGAAWGALLLLRIAWAGSFTAIGLQEINAHGHAQIFGWVGLFVMGFAYYGLPRLKQVPLAHPRMAQASLWLMGVGLVVRSGFQAAVAGWAGFGVPAVLGSLAEIAAIGILVWVVLGTLGSATTALEVLDDYVLTALGWFFVQAVLEAVYFTATLLAPGTAELLWLVATWQGPLREIQIHGFAMLMILGVSQRLLPELYGLKQPSKARSLTSLVVLNAALIGVVAGLVLMRLSGHAWAALWYLSVLVMVAATVALVWGWGLFGRVERSDRSLKYVRAAYVWLFISLAMLALLPAHQFGLLAWLAPESRAAEMGFSHAYYGAIRHGVTVGFVSMMIMGVAARMVPEFQGIRGDGLGPLWMPFLLVNAGCAIRVLSQTWTDFAAPAFSVAGPSGLLELTGLAIWGVHLWRIMDQHVELPGFEP